MVVKKHRCLNPGEAFGWTLGWGTVSPSGEVEIEDYHTYYEEGYPLNQWLPLFRSEQKATAHILAYASGPAPDGLTWACGECTAYGLLVILLDNPNIEAVVWDPYTEDDYVVPADRMIDLLNQALGYSESEAA